MIIPKFSTEKVEVRVMRRPTTVVSVSRDPPLQNVWPNLENKIVDEKDAKKDAKKDTEKRHKKRRRKDAKMKQKKMQKSFTN